MESKTLDEVERLLFDKGLKVRNVEVGESDLTIMVTGSDENWQIVETWDRVGENQYAKREQGVK